MLPMAGAAAPISSLLISTTYNAELPKCVYLKMRHLGHLSETASSGRRLCCAGQDPPPHGAAAPRRKT
eukprot:6183846-Pleurochrysis_carterae.AAC.3